MASQSIATSSSKPASATPPPWIPIRSLASRHAPRMAEHLVALDASDRYLRFGYPATDEQIARYVESIDFERDEVFGVFNRRLVLIAAAHLAFDPTSADAAASTAEFVVSVLPGWRGRNIGARLFDHAMLRARNRGVDTLLVHALSENAAMLAIARHAGAIVERDGSESLAQLKVPADTLMSHLDEAVENTAAEIDFGFKRQRRFFEQWAEAFSGAKTHIQSGGQDLTD